MASMYFLAWLGVIGLWGSAVAAYDKWAAKHRPRRRIRERTLLWLGFLGGAPLMYPTMKLLRHKTRHKNIMRGLGADILLHLAVLGFLLYKEGTFDWWISHF